MFGKSAFTFIFFLVQDKVPNFFMFFLLLVLFVSYVLNSYFEDLVNVFEVFLPQLLLYPNPSDPLNGEAAALMMRDRAAYEQRVKGIDPFPKSYFNGYAVEQKFCIFVKYFHLLLYYFSLPFCSLFYELSEFLFVVIFRTFFLRITNE